MSKTPKERRDEFYRKYKEKHGIHYSTQRYYDKKEEERQKDIEEGRCFRYGCTKPREEGHNHCARCLVILRLNNRGMGKLIEDATYAFRVQGGKCSCCSADIPTYGKQNLPTKESWFSPEVGWICRGCYREHKKKEQ